MLTGKVEGIFIALEKGATTMSIEQAHVVPARGIEGDRYYAAQDQVPDRADAGRQITLIEIEALEAMRRDEGIQITPAQTRRNVITRGIALNELVNRLFYVGNVLLRGVRLCEPCKYLASRTDPRILSSMIHRGGLRTDILSEGIIRINDIITVTGQGE